MLEVKVCGETNGGYKKCFLMVKNGHEDACEDYCPVTVERTKDGMILEINLDENDFPVETAVLRITIKHLPD